VLERCWPTCTAPLWRPGSLPAPTHPRPDAARPPAAAVAPQRIIVGISGASGAIYGVRLLQVLRECPGIETHLVVSDAGWRTLRHELGLERPAVEALAHQAARRRNVGASIASGSFQCHAMVVAPCSMRTLAAITHGLADNLLTRAADVVLKERRRLVLMARETPLHLGTCATWSA
jgi:4-hydroxy-3-polyprenylbenzoate decarboxylase